MDNQTPSRRNQKATKKDKPKKSPLKKLGIILGSLLLVLLVVVAIVIGKVYSDVKSVAKDVHESIDRVEVPKREEQTQETVNLEEQDSFSVLLLGIDTGDLGRTEHGRSDTIMVATVNPSKSTTTLVSIPRDTYTEIIGHGTSDKLNHAYAFGGAAMSMASVENLLDVPIDHFVQVNMKGLQQLVDAVGGIMVENDLAFSQSGIDFAKGSVMLNGESALAYIRMRHDDPNGDFGRQGRQRDVIQAVIKKTLNMSNITKYQEILNAVSDNMKTDLTWDQLKDISLNYRDAFSSIEQVQMEAPGGLSDGSYGEKGIYYELPTAEEITKIHDLIMGELNLAQ